MGKQHPFPAINKDTKKPGALSEIPKCAQFVKKLASGPCSNYNDRATKCTCIKNALAAVPAWSTYIGTHMQNFVRNKSPQ